MNLINTYLKAKHWQLFIAIFIPIYAIQYISSNLFIEQLNYYDIENIGDITASVLEIFKNLQYIFGVILLSTCILALWYWSITISFQKKIPQNFRINLIKFKIFFFIPLIYLILLFVAFYYFTTKIPDIINLIENGNFNEDIFEVYALEAVQYLPFILLFHLLAVFGCLHTLYFTAKTIKLAELKSKVDFGKFAGDFFLLLFNFIGIWIIQPKINKMTDAE